MQKSEAREFRRGGGHKFNSGWEVKNSRIHKLPQSPRPHKAGEVELCFISRNGAVTLVSLMSSTINRLGCRSAQCRESPAVQSSRRTELSTFLVRTEKRNLFVSLRFEETRVRDRAIIFQVAAFHSSDSIANDETDHAAHAYTYTSTARGFKCVRFEIGVTDLKLAIYRDCLSRSTDLVL